MKITLQKDPEILKFKKNLREFDDLLHFIMENFDEYTFREFIDKWKEILEFTDRIS